MEFLQAVSQVTFLCPVSGKNRNRLVFGMSEGISVHHLLLKFLHSYRLQAHRPAQLTGSYLIQDAFQSYLRLQLGDEKKLQNHVGSHRVGPSVSDISFRIQESSHA